ncbi:hypothetical protein HK102_009159, partial [Quaeritorhiza haematococci]
RAANSRNLSSQNVPRLRNSSSRDSLTGSESSKQPHSSMRLTSPLRNSVPSSSLRGSSRRRTRKLALQILRSWVAEEFEREDGLFADIPNSSLLDYGSVGGGSSLEATGQNRAPLRRPISSPSILSSGNSGSVGGGGNQPQPQTQCFILDGSSDVGSTCTGTTLTGASPARSETSSVQLARRLIRASSPASSPRHSYPSRAVLMYSHNKYNNKSNSDNRYQPTRLRTTANRETSMDTLLPVADVEDDVSTNSPFIFDPNTGNIVPNPHFSFLSTHPDVDEPSSFVAGLSAPTTTKRIRGILVQNPSRSEEESSRIRGRYRSGNDDGEPVSDLGGHGGRRRKPNRQVSFNIQEEEYEEEERRGRNAGGFFLLPWRSSTSPGRRRSDGNAGGRRSESVERAKAGKEKTGKGSKNGKGGKSGSKRKGKESSRRPGRDEADAGSEEGPVHRGRSWLGVFRKKEKEAERSGVDGESPRGRGSTNGDSSNSRRKSRGNDAGGKKPSAVLVEDEGPSSIFGWLRARSTSRSPSRSRSPSSSSGAGLRSGSAPSEPSVGGTQSQRQQPPYKLVPRWNISLRENPVGPSTTNPRGANGALDEVVQPQNPKVSVLKSEKGMRTVGANEEAYELQQSRKQSAWPNSDVGEEGSVFQNPAGQGYSRQQPQQVYAHHQQQQVPYTNSQRQEWYRYLYQYPQTQLQLQMREIRQQQLRLNAEQRERDEEVQDMWRMEQERRRLSISAVPPSAVDQVMQYPFNPQSAAELTRPPVPTPSDLEEEDFSDLWVEQPPSQFVPGDGEPVGNYEYYEYDYDAYGAGNGYGDYDDQYELYEEYEGPYQAEGADEVVHQETYRSVWKREQSPSLSRPGYSSGGVVAGVESASAGSVQSESQADGSGNGLPSGGAAVPLFSGRGRRRVEGENVQRQQQHVAVRFPSPTLQPQKQNQQVEQQSQAQAEEPEPPLHMQMPEVRVEDELVEDRQVLKDQPLRQTPSPVPASSRSQSPTDSFAPSVIGTGDQAGYPVVEMPKPFHDVSTMQPLQPSHSRLPGLYDAPSITPIAPGKILFGSLQPPTPSSRPFAPGIGPLQSEAMAMPQAESRQLPVPAAANLVGGGRDLASIATGANGPPNNRLLVPSLLSPRPLGGAAGSRGAESAQSTTVTATPSSWVNNAFLTVSPQMNKRTSGNSETVSISSFGSSLPESELESEQLSQKRMTPPEILMPMRDTIAVPDEESVAPMAMPIPSVLDAAAVAAEVDPGSEGAQKVGPRFVNGTNEGLRGKTTPNESNRVPVPIPTGAVAAAAARFNGLNSVVNGVNGGGGVVGEGVRAAGRKGIWNPLAGAKVFG